ncbi:hypothetical protein AB0B63_07155 [Micromonospora sp. NPDC049081]|uniref:hypothetical protein n=1 Tax=Micromonospora sp. NPDC049081 TaxID=3155150 RepID=UPI0033FD0891
MAAVDTMPHIAARIRNLLTHGRRITVTQRYTYVDRPPDVTAGLTLDTSARNGGITEGVSGDGHHLGVYLRPGLMSGFGVSAYVSDGNRVEAEVWKRYHAAESTSSDPFKRRRNMTLVEITGGLPGDGPGRDDRLVVRHWNSDGVCDERVVVFDGGPRDGGERAARWLYANSLGPAYRYERECDWDFGKVPDGEVQVWTARAAELLDVVSDEGSS